MKLPELEITTASRWSSPEGLCASKPRFVTRYELECYETDGGETCIDGEWFSLRRGCISFDRPGQIRHSRFPFSTGFIYFKLESPHRELEELIARIPPMSTFDPEKSRLFWQVHKLFSTEPMRASILLIELFYRLAQAEPIRRERPSLRGQSELYAAIGFMQSNLDRRVSVSEMATAAGYSQPHFTARFKELVGRTPYEYFNLLRLGEAKRLLASEGLTVAETVERLDFGSVSHFCSSFKKHYGMSPTEFIKNGRSSEYDII